MKTIQAYRFALDLTPVQERAIRSHAGAARVAHNWALVRVMAAMGQRAAERSYGIAEELLTPSLSWYALSRALRNRSDSRAGKRAGRPVGFPRFRSRRRGTPSVRFTTGTVRVEPDRMVGGCGP